MSTRTNDVFTKSLIAAAVLSLTACSSMPKVEDYDLSRVGDGILKAGRTTADVSGRVWNRTTYLLGFSDDDGQGNVADEGLLMDAEDVAVLEESEAGRTDTVVRPIVIRSAVPSRQDAMDQTPMNMASSPDTQTPINSAVDTDLVSTSAADSASDRAEVNEIAATSTIATTSEVATEREELAYEVSASETLWDIAKSTTGDATNWHVLADSNSLGPGAAVYPGQTLIIPGHMLKPEHTGAESTEDTQTADGAPYVDTQNLADNAPTMAGNTSSTSGLPVQQTPMSQGQDFQVKPGETLWDFSKRVTGDATNWQIIAEENDFTNEQAALVRSGQTIRVPDTLIEPVTGAVEAVEQSTESLPQRSEVDEKAGEPAMLGAIEADSSLPEAAGTSSAQPQEPQQNVNDDLDIRVITSAGAASRQKNVELTEPFPSDILTPPESILDETQPIKIIEATYKVKENAAPLPAPQSDETMDSNQPAEVMVSGTYYPKAVYNEADFSSSLLMRVSPGTTLQVSRSIGNWYQVKTSKGLGYVHQRDIR